MTNLSFIIIIYFSSAQKQSQELYKIYMCGGIKYKNNIEHKQNYLIHTGLHSLTRNLILLYYVNNSTPSGYSVSVAGIDQGLADSLKKIVRLQIRLVQRLAHTVQLFRACTTHHKVLRQIQTANQVHIADERLKSLRIQSSDYGFDEIRSESPFVQEVGDHGAEGFGMDFPALLELVEIQSETQSLHDGLAVGGESRQAEVQMWSHFVDFLEIRGDGLGLNAEPAVGRYRDAIFALHRHNGTPIVR